MDSVSKLGAALHDAIDSNQFNAAKAILGKNPSCVDEQKGGWTPLHRAANGGHEALAVLLLEHGAAVNITTQNRSASPLLLAASWGCTSVLARLIEWGADVNQAANDRWNNETALHQAAALKESGSLHLLLLRGAAANPVNGGGMTPLDVAVKYSHSANATILIEFGGLPGTKLDLVTPSCPLRGIRSKILDLQMNDFVGRSGEVHLDVAMVWATSRGSVRLLEYLLEIDEHLLDVCDEDGWVPLHHAAWKGNMRMTEALLSRCARANVCTKTRRCTPLHLAAQRGHAHVVDLLLVHGAEPMLQTRHGSNARMLGIRSGRLSVLRILDKHAEHQRRLGARPILPHRPADVQANRKKRLVSNQDYRLYEKDDDDSSDDECVEDGYEGRLFGIMPDFVERRTFTSLITVFKDWCQLAKQDTAVKVAVIDTGFDLENRDLNDSRVEEFFQTPQGDLGARLAKDHELTQISRVVGKLNLARAIQKGETDIQDLDGHGTRIAGIILRLAPTAQLYIARVCDGARHSQGDTSPTPRNVIKAMDWAIQQRVDFINLSLGFTSLDKQLRDAARRVKDAGIVIFASMSNDGNYIGFQEWPGNDFSVAIGISSCKRFGTYPSEFSPPAIPGNPNFLVAGEEIVAHKLSRLYGPKAKVSDRFELATGSSYATAVATSMGALIVGFIRQKSCKEIRKETRLGGLDVKKLLKDHRCMAMLLKEVGRPVMDYHWISPSLLWTEFQPSKEEHVGRAARKHAWNIISKALDEYRHRDKE
ncbi:Putative peptidase S8/S53 domain, peptidase S8, subtilisin, Asp-active [Colletotrichum destructivum]|uniref:Peptidase S8/S53 domain, peptidase S8, subtilisin, Asp-active n=1 Tax=Colletotrichum destructivum TaxID=34406 RepID=A0AAX4IXK1_9PEZI|nr:Putative peptidase S8/S53 domain, peptidase S8, subtilisin, Asp-active [Colletotrichum destructivum]